MALIQDKYSPTGLMWYQVPYTVSRQNIVATVTRKDGYNGHTCKVAIALVSGWAIAVTNSGLFKFSESKYQDVSEMLYYLREHTKVFNSSIITVDTMLDQTYVDSLIEAP
jgi:hypothetical protein